MTTIGPRVVQDAREAPAKTLGKTARKSLTDNKAEGTGLEPVSACARRFSRSIEGPAGDSNRLRSPVRRPNRSAIEARGTAQKSPNWSKLVQRGVR